MRTTGDIDIDNAQLVSESRGGRNSGDITLTSTEGNIFFRDTSGVGAPGAFVTTQTSALSTGTAGNITLKALQGDILVADTSLLFTSVNGSSMVPGGGGIEFAANNLTGDSAFIQIDNFLSVVPGNITVNVSDHVNLSGGSSIQTTTRGPARSSDLNITAHDVLLNEGSFLSTETFGAGDAGTLNIFAENLQLSNGAQLRSRSARLDRQINGQFIIPSGSGGTINIQGPEGAAGLVKIEGVGSEITTDTQGTGDGGSINILAENLQLTDGGQLSSGSSIGFTPPEQDPFIPTGSSGTINIGNGNPVALVEIEGTGTGIFTDTAGTGDAGSIIVNAVDLTMKAGAEISSSSTRDAADAGDGGLVNINANNSIALNASTVSTSAAQGQGGNIEITAGQFLQLTNATTVSAESAGAGNSGTVRLTTHNGNFQSNNSMVSTSAQVAEGGAINISAGKNVKLMNTTTVRAESSDEGNSGAVTIEASGGNFESDNSTVSTSSQNAKGGDIAISAGQNVKLMNRSSVRAESAGAAQEDRGGNINIKGGKDVDLDDSTISAESSGLGNAGDITVTAGNAIQMFNSTISTEAADASGGNIKLTSSFLQFLTNSRITSSVKGGPGTEGGNIDLDPSFIIVQSSEIRANAFEGNGGNITLTATDAIFVSSDSIIDASSELGTSGEVKFNSPIVVLAEVVAPLPKNFVIPQSLFSQRCAAQVGGQYSSFTQGAPVGLPPAPGGFLPSPLMFNIPPNSPSTGGMTQTATLPQIRLGLDLGLNFSTISLLPEHGCAA